MTTGRVRDRVHECRRRHDAIRNRAAIVDRCQPPKECIEVDRPLEAVMRNLEVRTRHPLGDDGAHPVGARRRAVWRVNRQGGDDRCAHLGIGHIASADRTPRPRAGEVAQRNAAFVGEPPRQR